MITTELLREYVEECLKDSPYFLVDVIGEPDDRYVVEIDSEDGVDIDYCIELSRKIEEKFPREENGDDYELEVGSAGLTTPFKVKRQYDKNIGQDIEVQTRDGRKLRGVLAAAGPESFTLQMRVKEKPEGAKRPIEVDRTEEIPYTSTAMVRCDIKF